MSFIKGLKCKECRRKYPIEPLYVCEYCFGPLEVDYNYKRIEKELTREIIDSRPKNLWRYRELLPVDQEPTDGLNSGFTPLIRPVRPNTIAKSLAIGNPADGIYAVETVKESGGWAEDVSDEEIVESIKLLASTEGIFSETAGGVTLGVTKKLIEQGRIPKDESIVVCITGNGLKTQEAVREKIGEPLRIKPNIASFEEVLRNKRKRRI